MADDEPFPLFRVPPGQPEPTFEAPILARVDGEFRWARDRRDIRDELARAARSRWLEWRSRASAMFAAAPAGWAEACERVASLDDPRAWMAVFPAQRAPTLLGLALPTRDAVAAAHWTAAWIGFGGALERVVACSPETAERIERAAAIVRASPSNAS